MNTPVKPPTLDDLRGKSLTCYSKLCFLAEVLQKESPPKLDDDQLFGLIYMIEAFRDEVYDLYTHIDIFGTTLANMSKQVIPIRRNEQ